MNGAQAALDVALVLLGGTGLVEGLSRLSTSPLSAVLIILSAMLFLLFPIAGLCGSEIRSDGKQRNDEEPKRSKTTFDS
ncbi:MAG TPA: hypothetical protein VLT90_03175 [Terriglobales bacterium]|nr:hypothetical protein [Terriglobales bacterium]